MPRAKKNPFSLVNHNVWLAIPHKETQRKQGCPHALMHDKHLTRLLNCDAFIPIQLLLSDTVLNTVKTSISGQSESRTPIKWTTWHARIELFNTNKPPNKGHLYLKDNTECTNVWNSLSSISSWVWVAHDFRWVLSLAHVYTDRCLEYHRLCRV